MPRATFNLAPLCDDGLFMLVSESMLIVRIDARLTPRAFDRYKAEWLRTVDARSPKSRVGAFYDIPEWNGFQASQRREWALMLKSREEVLRRTTVGMVLSTPSPLVRGALRAIYWLAPPPFPHSICQNVEDAWAMLSTWVDALDPALAVRTYRALIAKYVPAPTRTATL